MVNIISLAYANGFVAEETPLKRPQIIHSLPNDRFIPCECSSSMDSAIDRKDPRPSGAVLQSHRYGPEVLGGRRKSVIKPDPDLT